MNKTAILTIAGLALFQAGCAEPSAQAAPSGATALSPGVSSEAIKIFPDGSSCVPDAAEAAWGPGNVLLGYRCVRANSNG